MTHPTTSSQLSANKISLIILGASVLLTLVIGLVIASGKNDDSPVAKLPARPNENTDTSISPTPATPSPHTPPPFASVFLIYEKVRQAKLAPEFADLSLARDWATYTGTSLTRDLTRKSRGEILNSIQPIGDVGELQFFELKNFSFHTPNGDKIPGMYADKELGLAPGKGWRVPFTTSRNHRGDLVITIHYNAYRTNLSLIVRGPDGSQITSTPIPYNKKAICAIRTTLQNLQPDTQYSLELTIDSYYEGDSTRANSPHGLGINAIVVE